MAVDLQSSSEPEEVAMSQQQQQQQQQDRRARCKCYCCSRAISRHLLNCSSCSSSYHIQCLAEAFTEQQQQQQQQGGGAGQQPSSLVLQGSCLSCGARLGWLDLLREMRAYAEPQTRSSSRRQKG